MKLRINSWIVVLGFLVLAEIAAVLHLLPIKPSDVFWLAITVGCLWLIFRIFLQKPENPKK